MLFFIKNHKILIFNKIKTPSNFEDRYRYEVLISKKVKLPLKA
jgi:hypothetical protein